jgi:hypothetical protein
MSVRKFTSPTSLDQKISAQSPNEKSKSTKTGTNIKMNGDTNGIVSVKDDEKRSTESATKASNAYTQAEKQPIIAQKPHVKPGVTFAAQDKLPKLPIPELDDTAKRYLEALKPLQSIREQRDTSNAVDEFLRAEGPELQEKLKRYATGKSSYIEQFCRCLSKRLQASG